MRAGPLENSRKHRGPRGGPPKRPGPVDTGPVLNVPVEEFEALVGHALADLPPELKRRMKNVAAFVDDESPPGGPEAARTLRRLPADVARGRGTRGSTPDRITIFRMPILRHCATREQVVEQVRITVVHEVAHHFGIDDARLHELGYG